MKNKILAIVAVGLMAGPLAANAIIVGDFGAEGRVTLDLNADGTIAALAESFGGNIIGVALDAGFSSFAAPEYDFSPVNPDANGGNLFGWTSGDGEFLLGFYCGNDNGVGCTPTISWTIGSVGQFSSAFDVLGGTGSVYDMFLLTDAGSFSAFAEETSVPEPGTLALLGIGLAGLSFARRRKLN